MKVRVYPQAPEVDVGKRDLETVAQDIWGAEKDFLLKLLEARVLLRELLEDKMDGLPRLKVPQPPKPKLTGPAVELRRILALNPDDDDEDEDLSKKIAELRKQLVVQIRENQNVQRNLESFEKKIGLLIMNRSSIAELDRNAKKKKKKIDDTPAENENLILNDPTKMQLYSNLFYLLQTQPKYLARMTQNVPQKQIDTFIETIILTLFGDAFSPREEFLLLTMFKLAIQQEIQSLKEISDLAQVDSVVPKMIIAYNKRKQGKEYLLKTLTPLVTDVMDGKYNFDSEVEFESALNSFLEAIFGSINSIPYGFRVILKQMNEFLRVKFDVVEKEAVGTVFGFYYYFKFMNPSIIDPSQTGILTQDQVNLAAIMNLKKVAKVLQALFEQRSLPSGSDESKFNGWIKQKKKDVLDFFDKMIEVKSPEEELQVDRYTELYSKQAPIIIIRLHEIVEMHKLIKENIDLVVPEDKSDKEPMRAVIKELGEEIPKISPNNTTDTELSLKNKFTRTEQDLNDYSELFDVTKELIIKIFKITPVEQSPSPGLLEILSFAKQYGTDNKNKSLEKNSAEAKKNIMKLVAVGFIAEEDNFDMFMKSVVAEIANRQVRKQQQQKEIVKLTVALKELKNHHKFVLERIADMEKYLDSCRDQLAAKLKNKKKKANKFTYKQLVKDGVIEDSDVPEASRGKTVFMISMPELGMFTIETKIAAIPGPTLKLELEDLLAKKDAGETKLDLARVTLNVTPTIILMNKHFLR
uniref:Ras-GAP domain-containing protein n=1 Tax=Arcella intermedia TaxID=1963864 RepID=A0A6B2KY50_9EUKA